MRPGAPCRAPWAPLAARRPASVRDAGRRLGPQRWIGGLPISRGEAGSPERVRPPGAMRSKPNKHRARDAEGLADLRQLSLRQASMSRGVGARGSGRPDSVPRALGTFSRAAETESDEGLPGADSKNTGGGAVLAGGQSGRCPGRGAARSGAPQTRDPGSFPKRDPGSAVHHSRSRAHPAPRPGNAGGFPSHVRAAPSGAFFALDQYPPPRLARWLQPGPGVKEGNRGGGYDGAGGTHPRHRASGQRRAVHAQAREEPVVFPRSARHGAGARERGLGLSARLWRLRHLDPEADGGDRPMASAAFPGAPPARRRWNAAPRRSRRQGLGSAGPMAISAAGAPIASTTRTAIRWKSTTRSRNSSRRRNCIRT